MKAPLMNCDSLKAQEADYNEHDLSLIRKPKK